MQDNRPMNIDMHIHQLDLWLTGLALLTLLLATAEIGFRLGRRFARNQVNDAVRSQFTTIEGAEFALIGLLLAFTFSMAISRYESRRVAIVAESNAIGTAYLRAQTLEPVDAARLQQVLRDYTDTWIELSKSGRNPQRWDAARRRATELQDQAWAIAMSAARKQPTSVPVSLLIPALNEVFDRHTSSLAEFSNRLPGAVMVLLLIAALIVLGHVGYGNGMAGQRSPVTVAVLSVLIVTTIIVIMDFDRPRQGLLQLVPQSMYDLRQSMETPPASNPAPNPSKP